MAAAAGLLRMTRNLNKTAVLLQAILNNNSQLQAFGGRGPWAGRWGCRRAVGAAGRSYGLQAGRGRAGGAQPAAISSFFDNNFPISNITSLRMWVL